MRIFEVWAAKEKQMENKFCVHEAEVLPQSFPSHDYIELLNQSNGCVAGCRTGILIYRQTEFLQGGVHDDQEGFFVLEGTGRAKVGNSEFAISPGCSFIAPAGQYHYICRDKDSIPIRLFFFHASTVLPEEIK